MTLDEAIEKTLREEIYQGYFDFDDEGMSITEVNRDAISIMGIYLYDYFKKNFIKVPSSEEYRLKVKEIFGIDCEQKDIIMYENSIGEVFPEKFLIHEEDLGTLVLLSSKNFILPLFRFPEIINYQKLYPKLLKEESKLEEKLSDESEQILWKEICGNTDEYQEQINNNLLYIIRLNKYIFNNDKTHLDWLFEENPLLDTLVSSYGYNEDIQLVEKVINERGVDENFYLDDLVWFKGSRKLYGLEEEPSYDGKFRIQHNTFIVIYNKLEGQKFHVPTQNIYLKALHRLLVELDEEEVLSQEERKKLKCYMVDFLDEFLLDSSHLESLESACK